MPALATRLLISLLLCSLLLPAAPPVAAAPLLQVSARSSPGLFEFIATGFRHHEMISTWLTGPSQQVIATAARKTDQFGGILFTLYLPRFYEPGRWALTAHGLASDLEAIAYFDLPPRGADVPMAISPLSGPPGTLFTAVAVGFQVGEKVSTWLTGPNGRAVDGPVVETSPGQRITVDIVTDAQTARGLWMLTAYGRKSDRLAVIGFLVE